MKPFSITSSIVTTDHSCFAIGTQQPLTPLKLVLCLCISVENTRVQEFLMIGIIRCTWRKSMMLGFFPWNIDIMGTLSHLIPSQTQTSNGLIPNRPSKTSPVSSCGPKVTMDSQSATSDPGSALAAVIQEHYLPGFE